jgi:hypothetical protein
LSAIWPNHTSDFFKNILFISRTDLTRPKGDPFPGLSTGQDEATRKLFLQEMSLHWPPSLHNDIVAFFLDLDLDPGILVRNVEYPEFLCIDHPLQGKHIGPVHAFEIVTLVEYFSHNFSLP